jgi:hypothetical protein
VSAVALLALVHALPVPGTGSAPSVGIADAQAVHPAKMDELLIVDCLLPGQVRRLGSKLTMLTARRAMKTSQRDCEIRGGEYVSYDRANYSTALKVWQPMADQGDPAAQVYVGEIHEKGLGVPPDHAKAAEWYRRAAEKGFPRAAINLGHLYERGLGVPQDQAKALDLYRQAAAGTAVKFEIVAPVETGGEVTRLRTEIADLRSQLEARQRETERTRQELDTVRRSLDQRRTENDGERAELARLRKALEESRGKEQSATHAQREIERALAEREARFAARERELAQRGKSDVDQQRAETERQRAEAERQRAEAERERVELARLRKELTDARGKEGNAAAALKSLERAVAEREARLSAKEQEVADVRAALTRTELAAATQRSSAEREIASLRASLSKLEGEAAARREASRPAPAAAAPTIELIEPELVALRSPGVLTARLVSPATSVVLVGRVKNMDSVKSLTVNGREEPVDSQKLFKAQLALPSSEERVRIVAVDGTGRKSTLEFLVLHPGDKRSIATADDDRLRIGHAKSAGANFGNYHALVIGINDYKLLRPLKTANNDAKEIARALSTEYGFKTTLLLNASRYDILSALNTLRERLTDKDNLLIYYAGHGQLDQLNQRGHWLPIDAEPESSANWISNIAITDILNAMTTRQILVVSDSCYSGALTRSALGQLEAGLSEQQLSQVLASMAQKRARMVLTSGGLEPVLDGGGGGTHSVFARNFLDLLRANQGVLPGQELFRHLRLRVAAQAERVRQSQVPEYAPIKYAGHEAGDFFFVRASN